MITKYCTKCGSKWLVSNPNASECPKCDGALRGETNGDKIRSMNDEELAEYLEDFSDRYYRYDKSWLDWLKQEAT